MIIKVVLVFLGIVLTHQAYSVECVKGALTVIEGLSSIGRATTFAKMGIKLAGKTEKMSDYKRAQFCNEKIAMKGITAQAWRCKDGSITYDQPKSTGIGGYNGFCGETAASNILHMHCGLMASPTKYCNSFTKDFTPGTRAGSLKTGLNSMFKENKPLCPEGKWESYSSSGSPEEYIQYLLGGLKQKSNFTRTRDSKGKVKIFPFPIMIEVPPVGSKGLHWVTVLDVIGYKKGKDLEKQTGCEVMINHWGDQYKVPCTRLALWAKRSGCGAAGMVCGEYPRVKFIPK
ncbi:hypothetical protein A9Q84_17930 [Halobacteriovorax marinus]|uniref:Uncharacterized protein n=1 Tax=Halobacteriovorax marinus TaxID=97084 RepID=A0A1Y5F3N5_9BACT|nr:hypothetical protein A9Q84_17930 [Halobacteriovorax marinus]